MIRVANENDIKALNDLGEKLHDNFKNLFHIETEIDNPMAIVLVSVDGNRVNGYLYALNLGDNIDILSIFVDNMYRLRHIGTNLIDSLKNLSNGSITLEVSEDNTSALKLYSKSGFKVVGNRKKYYINSDAYIMKWEGEK